jgi:hypothetical protein
MGRYVVWYVGSDVSEGHVASKFRIYLQMRPAEPFASCGELRKKDVVCIRATWTSVHRMKNVDVCEKLCL